MSEVQKIIKSVAAIIIYPDGKLLMVKRKGEPYNGYWSLAGGKVEAGETPQEACLREVKEETGLDVEIIKYIGNYVEFAEYKGISCEFRPTCYVVKPKDISQLKAQETEVSDIQLFTVWDAMYLPLAFKHNEMVLEYLRWYLNSPYNGFMRPSQ
jgi:8-oxo-dGTP diphosphatase